jgi:hypothetical protein
MPYTYLIGWSTQNKYYYGCRYAKNSDPSDLWVTYFTSSKYVTRMREAHGDPDVVQVRRMFTSREECVQYESRVLRRIVGRANFINKNVAGAIVSGNPTPRTDKQRAAARACMSALSNGVWYTNGFDMKRLPLDTIMPPGWYRGYPEHYKRKLSKILSGRPGQFKDMKWYNNGHERARYREDRVPHGWVVGWKLQQPK